MTKRTLLLVAVTIVPLLAPLTGTTRTEEGRPPNFIIILADDLGYDDVGCYWSPIGLTGIEPIETPNIDRMAEEGMRFTDFYMAASVCTPSRAALLTGCYPPRVGMSRRFPGGLGVLSPNSEMGLNPTEVTIAEVLKARGYRTACVGKWHLGDQPPFLATQQGFDTYYGVTFRNEGKNRVQRNQKYVETVDNAELTHRYTRESIRFIKRNKDKPFFLYLAHGLPHVPLAVTKDCAGRSKRGIYGDAVACIDRSTGEILDTLKELGIAERTLVVFTSDNGPESRLRWGDHAGYAFPLRGIKASAYDGGFRVPCVVTWPGKIPGGTRCREMCTAMDFLPTFAALAGAGPPENEIDGKDIWPLLTGDPRARTPYEVFYYYSLGELKAIRTSEWKLMFVRDPESDDVVEELYNMRLDSRERKSVIKRQRAVADALEKIADQGRNIFGDESLGIHGAANREPGRTEVK